MTANNGDNLTRRQRLVVVVVVALFVGALVVANNVGASRVDNYLYGSTTTTTGEPTT